MRYYGYEDGSAVRKIADAPEKNKSNRKQTGRRHAKNAAGRRNLSRGYVAFLAGVCIVASALCITFLRQKATITSQYEQIAELESKYNNLKNDNDARYNQVIGSVSMEDVKKAAEERLGMHYAGEDQIMYYDLSDGSYVRQYKDVPNS
jgi:cell division protein FtsL